MGYYKHKPTCRDERMLFDDDFAHCRDCKQSWKRLVKRWTDENGDERESAAGWTPVDEKDRQVWPYGAAPWDLKRKAKAKT